VERRLQRLSWLRIRELVPAEIDTAVLPVGTVEAHGAACLGTDIYIPEDIAGHIAERLNALVAPTVTYGITKSLLRYNGGATVRPETFGAYVRDVLDSLAAAGFRHVIVINGHGGNNAVLKDVAYAFHAERRANIAVIHWWQLCADMTENFFGHIGGHAGTDETAYIWAMDPALADRERYDPDLAYTFNPGADVYPVPGTILLYKAGEGYPEFDDRRAKEYREKVIDAVGEFAAMVLGRWRKFGL